MENCLITCTSDGLPCFNLHLTEGSNLFPPSFVSSICYRPAVNSAHVVARPVERSCLYHRLKTYLPFEPFLCHTCPALTPALTLTIPFLQALP
ncbi:hypothetical protein MAP00_007201 [Monascus purpureus]|nr:hypothetical protein MAP00_007201 [Monascus purpureus]